MATLEALRAQGWHLSSEGFSRLCENESLKDTKNVIKRALDVDLRDIGASILATEITKDVFGPVVLQILKLRNISASKAKPNSQTAPRMLKLSLTDGHTNCQAVEMKQIPALTLDHTVPGTKLLIDNAQVIAGCLILDLKCCKVLGGNVAALVERWEVSKLMPTHVRVTEDGPPAWVNFGKKIITNLNKEGFKSLENKNKENTKEDAEFQNQRQDAISEAAQGAVKKVFGGGVKAPQTFSSNEHTNNNNNNSNNRASNKPVRKGREKPEMEKVEKPSQRVSLFDFLEDKLPATEPPKSNTNVKIYNNDSKNNYQEPVKESFNKFNKPQNKYNERRENENPRGGSGNRYQNDRNKFQNDRKDFEHRPGSENRYQQRNDRRDNENRSENRYQNDRSENRYPNERSEPRYQNDRSENRYQNERSDNRYTNERSENRYQNERSENRYQNDRQNKYNNERKDFEPRPNPERYQNEKPPRFQKQRVDNPPKFVPNSFEQKHENPVKYPQTSSNSNTREAREVRSKPDTNNFINKLANEINNISLYNSKYENEKLHKPGHAEPAAINTTTSTTTTWKWKSGDRCMAKYWEDNKFYNAVVTGVTNRTCMVEFLEYGNFEEVLHCDCIPVTSEKEDQQITKNFPDNQQSTISGNIEFRRGKNRPFVRNQNKPFQGNRNYES